MNELLIEFLNGYEGMLPDLKLEFTRMNTRLVSFRMIARKNKVTDISYEIEDFNDARYIVMEGLFPYGDNPNLDTIHCFKMCAEMQFEEDKSGKSKLFTVGEPTYVIRRGEKGIHFRVDLPFSDESRKVLGGGKFFDKFLEIIIKEGE